jgi:uncharacterized protein GlcG (DUF336 family)
MIASLESMQRRLIGLLIGAVVFVSPRLVTGQANRVRLTLGDAQAIVAAAQRSAAAMDVRVSIAVVDPRGDLIAIERMSGANAASADTTIGKAMVSAIFMRPSGLLAARGATNPTNAALNEATGGRLRFIAGGVPVVRGGLLLGAVAAGGGTSQQDEKIATEGAAAVP